MGDVILGVLPQSQRPALFDHPGREVFITESANRENPHLAVTGFHVAIDRGAANFIGEGLRRPLATGPGFAV